MPAALADNRKSRSAVLSAAPAPQRSPTFESFFERLRHRVRAVRGTGNAVPAPSACMRSAARPPSPTGPEDRLALCLQEFYSHPCRSAVSFVSPRSSRRADPSCVPPIIFFPGVVNNYYSPLSERHRHRRVSSDDSATPSVFLGVATAHCLPPSSDASSLSASLASQASATTSLASQSTPVPREPLCATIQYFPPTQPHSLLPRYSTPPDCSSDQSSASSHCALVPSCSSLSLPPPPEPAGNAAAAVHQISRATQTDARPPDAMRLPPELFAPTPSEIDSPLLPDPLPVPASHPISDSKGSAGEQSPSVDEDAPRQRYRTPERPARPAAAFRHTNSSLSTVPRALDASLSLRLSDSAYWNRTFSPILPASLRGGSLVRSPAESTNSSFSLRSEEEPLGRRAGGGSAPGLSSTERSSFSLSFPEDCEYILELKEMVGHCIDRTESGVSQQSQRPL